MALTDRLRRTGFRKGVQGNRTWLALGIAVWGAQRLRRLAQPEAEILLREELRPGDRMVIANGRATVDRVEPPEPVPARRGRRRRSRGGVPAAAE